MSAAEVAVLCLASFFVGTLVFAGLLAAALTRGDFEDGSG